MTAPETNAGKRPEAAVEYGVRYREAPPFWRGRGKVHVGAVSDGSLEAAEYGARAFMTIGFRGVQVIQRDTLDGPWTLHHKVNPGRLLVRKLTGRVNLRTAAPAMGSADAARCAIGLLLIGAGAALGGAQAYRDGVTVAWTVTAALYVGTAAALAGLFIASRRSRLHVVTVDYVRAWPGVEAPGEWMWLCRTCQAGEGQYGQESDARSAAHLHSRTPAATRRRHLRKEETSQP
jgi:hypothetical protein